MERVKDRLGLFHQLGGLGIALEQRCGLCPLRKQGFLQDSEEVWEGCNPFRDDIQWQPILGGCPPIQHSIMLCGGMNIPISQMGPLRLRKWYIIVPSHVPSGICTYNLWHLKHSWNMGWRDEWFQGLKDTFLRVYVFSSLFTHFLEQNKFQEVVTTVT